MDELSGQVALKSPIQIGTLGQLCDLPMDARCSLLLRHDRQAFELALRTLERGGASANMDAGRLAWAVASNIDGVLVRDANGRGPQRSSLGYRDHWPADAPWPVVWSVLVKPLVREDAKQPATLLAELAVSVACEQRSEWQPPSTRPIHSIVANRMFEWVYASNRTRVLGACRHFGGVGSDLEAIANEAWSRVFCDYWSTHASRRFLGISRISTLVCQVARYISIDSIRNNARFVSSDEKRDDANDNFPSFANPVDTRPGPLANAAQNELKAKIRECMGRLPAKGRIVAEMVWLRELNAKQAAQILRVSEPAISQHLKKAREIVGTCLRAHGFNLPS